MKRSRTEVEFDEDNTASKRRKLNKNEESVDEPDVVQLLPKETWLHIISGKNIMLVNSIDNMNVWNFREVNKYFKQIIDESAEISWIRLYFSHFGGITDQIRHSPNSWKQIYLEARSGLNKAVEDQFEEKNEEIANLLEHDDSITIEKAQEDYDAFWELVHEEAPDEHEVYQKLAEFMSKNKCCAMVPIYLGSYQKDIHMNVFHMLFEEKHFKTWIRYLEDNDFDQMEGEILLCEEYIGNEETGEYKIENIPRVLDMADMYDTCLHFFVAYWQNNEEQLRAQIEKSGSKELLERIEQTLSKLE